MLCFLPPVMPPLPPRGDRPRRTPPSCGAAAGTVMVVSLVGVALLTPIGWERKQLVYAMQVGVPAHLDPGPENLPAPGARAGSAAKPIAFYARQERYSTVPPGLRVDAVTGAVVGTPSMAGTYTITVGSGGGTQEPRVGAPFKIRIAPAT